MTSRIETDLLGPVEVSADALWGAHTERARRNFDVSGYRVPGRLIRALARVKKACCLANRELGHLPEDVAGAVTEACQALIRGEYADQFPVDALQGGAGTSTNMNVNEVVANLATERLGGRRGEYGRVHPIETVNLHQSTNDVYPTALRVAAIEALRELSAAAAALQGAFQRKEKEFAGVVKIGRTQLQEAVPVTLGAEFAAFAEALSRDRWRTFKCEERLRVVNLGGTAVGTGVTAPRRYIFLVVEKLREVTGYGLCRGEHGMDQTANADALAEVSGILQAAAANLVKIASDLRLLHAWGEIRLPALQAGSSVMPGKVNPVLCECAMQVGMRVMAGDALIAQAVSRGSLQINEWLPVVAFTLLDSLDSLTRVFGLLAGHVDGIGADPARCRALADGSVALITPFVPVLGYERCTELVRAFAGSGRDNLRTYLEEHIGAETVARVLAPDRLSALGYRDDENRA